MSGKDEWEFFFKKWQLPDGTAAVTAEEAEESLLEQLEQSGGTCRKTLLQLARVRSSMGKHSEALTHLERLLQLSDDIEENASYFLALGQLMEQLGDHSAATEYYRGGFRLKPSRPTTWYWINNNLGYCLNELKRYDEAEPYLRTAIETAPKMSNAYKNLGLCFLGQGDYAQAAENFVSAVRADASDIRPFKHLEGLVKSHPEILSTVPDLSRTIDLCRKAAEYARQKQPDFKEQWRRLRRKQGDAVPEPDYPH